MTGSYRFSKNYISSEAMDKSKSEIYTFLRPYDDNTTFLMSFSEQSFVARVFQNFSFQDDHYMLLFDDS